MIRGIVDLAVSIAAVGIVLPSRRCQTKTTQSSDHDELVLLRHLLALMNVWRDIMPSPKWLWHIMMTS